MSLSPGKLLVGAAIIFSASVAVSADGGEEAPAIPAPAAPADSLPPLTPVTPFDPAQAGAAPGAPSPYSADPTAGDTAPDISAAPPPLSSLAPGSADASTTGAAGTTLAAGPVETYEFLYREDPELGVIRERYTSEEALQRRNLEIARLLVKYQQPAGPGGQQPPGADPRAAAEWDFYFEQVQLYSEYVKNKVLRVPEGEEFPVPTYEAETAVQNAEDLEREYNELAIRVLNEQWNENQEFYERVQAREDRRRDYVSWLTERERDLAKWADIWARRINGQNWTDGQPVNRDDWYYGTHFNAVAPVLTQVGGQEFLLSREPQRNLRPDTLNALSTNLNPYDVVDHYGNVKSPAVERARGTIVRPEPVPVFEVTTGTVEMAM